jgi:predicted transcriptional regulator
MARGPDVPEAELAVLSVLWEDGESTRREIADRLYPGGGAAQYATVQKLLERLRGRGLVTQGGTPQRRTFTAAVGRDELIGLQLRGMADRLCDGSLSPLLMSLVKAQPLSEAELEELRQLVRDQSRKPRREG